MNRADFKAALQAEGYRQFVTVTRESGDMKTHSHPFEAKALILQGEITIVIDSDERVFRVGEVFHLLANQAHAERYGSEGVQYLAGRK